jgi:hypothetical protein
MSRPTAHLRRPAPCLEPRPTPEMSGRGVALVLAVYAVLFAAAAAHHWLAG